ncbi:methyltransferase type 12 [Grosmannia clavigera kw1407]|uniref:Methyltransferase type 12 n=1 Tax=Grosmannia clavigera (strain kw1407 / UAMH 11150) TaxID=655863 RepID=F0XHS6_GROCL|nr:methyltransferase type 12 [Grosmannia clavigera kw1407]EFX03261.1 methyltransferase type 12 [Grosmannia clavigera kw1407]
MSSSAAAQNTSSGPASATASPVAAAFLTADEPILAAEVDDDEGLDDNSDSAYGDEISALTASVSSSILHYRTLHGRTFNSDKFTSQYFIPNDDQQQTSIDITHQYLTLLLDGAFFLAPIPQTVKRILDIGTGTGIWAIDVADQFPNAEVVGTDLSPIQSTWVPPNTKFEVDDAAEPWTWPENSFDFVHIRFLNGAISDWNALFAQAFRCCEPGGWFESCEYHVDFRSDDDTTKLQPALGQLWNLYEVSGQKLGRPLTVANDGTQQKAIEAAGFINIQERNFKLPVGGWPADPKLAQIGQYTQLTMLNDLEVRGYTTFMWNEVLKWGEAEYQIFLMQMRKALRDKKVHSYFTPVVQLDETPRLRKARRGATKSELSDRVRRVRRTAGPTVTTYARPSMATTMDSSEATATCRCIYRSDGCGCERCYRLKKECQAAVPLRRRAAVPKKTATTTLSRTAQLEQKLDGLVSLLTAHNSAMGGGSTRTETTETTGTTGTTGATATVSESGSGSSTPRRDDGGNGSAATTEKMEQAVSGSKTGYLPGTPDSSASMCCKTGATAVRLGVASAPTAAAVSGPSSTTIPLDSFNHNAMPLTTTSQTASADPGGLLQLDEALEPTVAEAERCLQTFRREMLPYLPFVHVTAETTAAALRQERPLFWLAIMTVVCRHVPWSVQVARSTRLRALFAQRAVVDCEKSLDLLLAMLTYISWVHFSSRRDRPTLSLTLQMAQSLVSDMGLHKAVASCKSLLARFMRDSLAVVVEEALPPPQPLLEERRAALGCYVLSSVLSISLKRTDPMRWTARMEEHVQALSAAVASSASASSDSTSSASSTSSSSHPLDQILLIQVRLQRIADQIYQSEWQMADPSCTMPGPSPPSSGLRCLFGHRAVPLYVARVLHGKIDDIKASVPTDLLAHDGVRGPLLCVEALLSACVVTAPMPLQSSVPANNITATTATASSSLPHPTATAFAEYANYVAATNATNLDRCVEAITRFCTHFLSIPSDAYPVVPFAYYTYFTSCVMLLHSLALVDDPSWDRTAAHSRINVIDILDGFIRAISLVAALRDQWASELSRMSATATVHASANANANANANAFPSGLPAVSQTWCAADPVATIPVVQPQLQHLQQMQQQQNSPQTVDMFYPDFFQTMGMTEDSIFWDVMFPGQDGSAAQPAYS